MNSTQKVAAAYLKKGVRLHRQATEEVAPPIATGRFIDLAVLVIAYDAYLTHYETADNKSSNPTKGLAMIKRYSSDLEAAFVQIVGPLAERPDAGSIRTPIHLALRVTSPTPAGIANWAKALRAVLPWVKLRTQVFNDLFTGKVARAARELAGVAEEESPIATLNRLAIIAPVSGLSAVHHWIETVAAEVGAPISSVESTLVAAQVAKGLGEQLVQVESSIAAAKENTPESADLQAQRTSLISQIGSVANASPNPDAVLAVAAQARPTHQFATETGKKVGLTGDQEEAMMARGRTVIAAGAGSGKTRVLAAKVAFHVNEQGIPATAVLATSFTRKASAELIKRCGDYGAVLAGTALEGFGTTHAIAGNLLNKRAPAYKKANYMGKKEGWKQTTLFRLAMDQVMMGKPGIYGEPPKPEGFWDKVSQKQTPASTTPTETVEPTVAPTDEAVQPPANELDAYLDAIDTTGSYFQWGANTWSGDQAAWAGRHVQFLRDMQRMDPKRLSDKQKKYLNDLFTKVTRNGVKVVQYRVAASEDAPVADVPQIRNRQNKLDSYTSHKTPVGQWFNLGLTLATEDSKGNKTPIPMGEFRRAVSILKGKGLSPTQAWAGEGPFGAESDHAAVYAAYEFLKGPRGETEFLNTGDMDDLLIDTVTALIDSPQMRRQVQSQFKVLLIDEAQDLNRVQHIMFGLIAGIIDPATLKPWPDGHMTADTYSLIGDDKQAIYEFRGADPEEFISKSNLVENGGDFKTVLLDTNFRSGEAIVQAANQLITHNKRQVPMTCKANVDRNGQGRIFARACADSTYAAMSVSGEIADVMESSLPGTAKYKSFGVAVRSNAEAYAYGLEMLKKGIPFKCNVQFFSDNNTKALIGWLTLADKGLDGPADLIEDAIRDAVKAPVSKMGPKFFSDMDEKATGSWATWLINGGKERIYRGGEYYDALQHFVGNLEAVAGFTGSPAEIVEKILHLTGVDGSSMREALVAAVRENNDMMAELAAATTGGIVSEEAIVEMALSPVEPLIGLMKDKDNLGAAMNYVRKLKNVNSKLASKDTDEEIDRDAVTIGTMHSWKGLEVDTMYIPMVGGKFPRAGSSEEALASERRLAYVAITRAEQRCVILDIPDPKPREGSPPAHSQFLSEACIKPEKTDMPVGEGEDEETPDALSLRLAAKWSDDELDKLASSTPLIFAWDLVNH